MNIWLKDRVAVSCGEPTISQLLALPKLEITKFDGDPQQYLYFMSIFEETVEKVAHTDDVKLTHLLQQTTGRAHDAVKSCSFIGGSTGYKEAKQILKERFGSDYLIAEGTIRDLRGHKPAHTASAIQKLADDTANAERILKSLNQLSLIDTQCTIIDIVERLSHSFRNDWRKRAIKLRQKTGIYPVFHDLVVFLKILADSVNDPVYGTKNSASRSFSAATCAHIKVQLPDETSRPKIINSSKCPKCGGSHRLFYCNNFEVLHPAERLSFVIHNKLCENCFSDSHVAIDCVRNSVCSVPGCGKKHSRYLHIDSVKNCHVNIKNTVFMPTVPVIINNAFKTRVLLDTASTNSFVSRNAIATFVITGETVSHELCTLSHVDNKLSEIVEIRLQSIVSDDYVSCFAYVVDSIPVSSPEVDTQRFSHFQDLPLNDDIESVDVLIGQDCSEALIPLEVRKGKKCEPFATRTMLGWSVNGSAHHGTPSSAVISNFVSATPLEENIQQPWNIDNDYVPLKFLPPEDRHVIAVCDSNNRSDDGYYELPITYADASSTMLDNTNQHFPSLKSIDPLLMMRVMFDQDNEHIQELMHKGYAEVVTLHMVAERDKKACCVPHHGARKNGFQQQRYTMADVEAIFNQAETYEYDHNVINFLWKNASGEVVHYRMKSHIFGVVWCVTCVFDTLTLISPIIVNGKLKPPDSNYNGMEKAHQVLVNNG